MKRQNTWFPEPVLDRADRIAKALDMRLPDVIRRALEEYVERNKKLIKDKES